MSGTASALRKHWLELVWALFAAANVAAILVAPEWETFPSHLLWVSLMLLYGFHVWRLSATAAVLTAVVLGVGGALAWVAYKGSAGWDELIEVPLMAAVFVAAAWHARRREAALERAERSATKEHEFVRDASHQLRTPITVARGHVELIASAGAGEEVAKDAEVALRELDRLETISDGLLIIAAADHPGFLGREDVDLERVIVNTARRWGTAAPRRWLVDVRAEGTLPADEERLLTALDALVENAVKFTQEDDRIAIVGRAEGGVAVLEVSDTGVGIPSAYLPRVFDRFSRSDGEAPAWGSRS
ncbi:MAG: sensor histidine kinase [Gaiellaceae bacterium]